MSGHKSFGQTDFLAILAKPNFVHLKSKFRDLVHHPREKKTRTFHELGVIQLRRDAPSEAAIAYKNEEREEEEEDTSAETVAAEEAEEEKEEVAGRRRNSVVNHRQYGITGKSAINQGSPGTELGNCLLKNRNDVNPGVPASESQPASQPQRESSARVRRAYISTIRKIKLIRPRSDSWVE